MSTRFIQKISRLAQLTQNIRNAGIGAFNGRLFANYDGNITGLTQEPGGKTYFVDANSGSNSNDGLAWGDAFLTMAKAFTSVASGDTIRFRGKIREQITCPVNVFDVTVIGEGNRPRHADAQLGGNTAANTWTTPVSEVAATPLVKVIQQGWRFVNILFAGPSAAACILLYRDAGAGDAERDASHAEILGCRFASGYDAINDTGGCYGVLVQGCRILAMSNYAIHGVGNIGVGQSEWQILDNKFTGNTLGVKIEGFACLVKGNIFDDGSNPGTAVVLDVKSTAGVNNHVVENSFQTTTANFNSPDIIGSTSDVWYNWSIDGTIAAAVVGIEAGVPA